MNRADEVVMKDMIAIMLMYGIIAQIICLFIPGNRVRMAIGLWIGIATGIGLLIHMRKSLLVALDLEEAGAKRYMQKSYAGRYFATFAVFAAALYFEVANVFTLIIGVMGLKVSAYLQPIMHKLFTSEK